MKQSVFYIAGMCCPMEQQLIQNRLKSFSGIERLDFNMIRREVTVSHSLEDDKNIFAALGSLNLGAQRKATDAEMESTRADAPEHSATISKKAKLLLGVSGLSALATEILAHAIGKDSAWPVIALAALSIVCGGRDTLHKAWVSLRTLTLNINFLMALAVIGAVCIGQWPEAAMVTFLFGVAEMVESFSLDRARNAIGGLMAMTPETATVRSGTGLLQEWIEVQSSCVQIGQTVRVRPGERIPLDGTVTAGASTVNQAPITGESIPIEKKSGDTVFAGSVNERGVFEFTVTANKGNTTLARIIRAVEEAQSQRAPTQRFIDDFARYYTPAVVVLALLVAALPPLFFGGDFSSWLYKALVMLVIACPCALVISTPVTVVSGLAAAARRGVLIKGGVYLEAGRKIRAVALDKTGTLTHGKPVLTDLVPLGAWEPDELLQLAASLDVLSEHPVASAIVAAWTKRGRKVGELLPVENFQSITGRGVVGTIGGTQYFVGNHRLIEENGLCGPHIEEALSRLEAEGKTAVVLTTDKNALAVLAVADTLRETSIEALQSLHALGVRCVMLTGDNQTTAQAIAQKVGIDDARGALLPEDKLQAIDELLAQYSAVAMVGDGINDAPALAKSSIGFAMGAAGTDTAIETADVALMEDDLRKLPFFIALSRQTGRVLMQNIAFAIGIKIVFFALALTGHATLWMAVFADMGGSLIVVFNGLRLLRYWENTPFKHSKELEGIAHQGQEAHSSIIST